MPGKRLEELLDVQIEQFETLLSASEALQHAVIHNHHEDLNLAMERLSAAQQELAATEAERMALLAQEGKVELTMSQYILQAEADRREGLTGRFARISQLVKTLKDMQEANTLLLREGLSYIQAQLGAVTPKKMALTYTRQGKPMAPPGLSVDKEG